MNRLFRDRHTFSAFSSGAPRDRARESSGAPVGRCPGAGRAGDPAERRSYTRRRYSVPISVSYFSGAFLFDAWTLDHGLGGLRFAARRRLEPRAVLYIAVKKFHPSGPCTGLCEGLRSVTLAEVMWSDRKIADGDIVYPTGVRYYQSVY